MHGNDKSAKPPRGVGRPTSLPPGTKVRTMRLTDREWDTLRGILAVLREFTIPKESQGK